MDSGLKNQIHVIGVVVNFKVAASFHLDFHVQVGNTLCGVPGPKTSHASLQMSGSKSTERAAAHRAVDRSLWIFTGSIFPKMPCVSKNAFSWDRMPTINHYGLKVHSLED